MTALHGVDLLYTHMLSFDHTRRYDSQLIEMMIQGLDVNDHSIRL